MELFSDNDIPLIEIDEDKEKDWTGNKVSNISTSGFRNNTEAPRQAHDFYATSPVALEKLLSKCKEMGITFSNVWEPACGLGHLSDVLISHKIHGQSSDLIHRGYIHQTGVSDFLAHPISAGWEGDIITNPPYKYATEFVYKCLELIPEGRKVAMIFPQRYLSSKSRYSLFTKHPPRWVFAFAGRVGCAINGDFNAASSSAVDYLWIVWEKGFAGDTILKWIL